MPASGRAQQIAQPSEATVEVQIDPYEEQIRQRAHEIWMNRGGGAGSDVEDWLRAEEEILGEGKV